MPRDIQISPEMELRLENCSGCWDQSHTLIEFISEKDPLIAREELEEVGFALRSASSQLLVSHRCGITILFSVEVSGNTIMEVDCRH